MAMRESSDHLTECSAALSNLPGSILGGDLDVRNEGSVARKLSCDGDALTWSVLYSRTFG